MPATETKVNIKPLSDRVVLEVLNDTEQTAGGIYIPDTAREKPQQGIVLAVGPGRLNDNGKRECKTGRQGSQNPFRKRHSWHCRRLINSLLANPQ
jgi:co-chaperonin GroES (HSP10)